MPVSVAGATIAMLTVCRVSSSLPRAMGTILTILIAVTAVKQSFWGQTVKACVTLQDNRTTLTFMEDEEVRVVFTVSDSPGCQEGLILIRVGVNSSSPKPICFFSKFNETAICTRDAGCWCEGTTSVSYVIGRRPQSEYEQWLIQGYSKSGLIFRQEIAIFENRFPNITGFHIASGNETVLDDVSADVNDSVTVTCRWTRSPLATKAALYKDAEQLSASQSNVTATVSQADYVIQRTACDHSGRYRCEVPWARNNRTVVLQVKCSAELTTLSPEYLIQPSGLLLLQFSLRVYSTSVTQCTFWRYPAEGEAAVLDHLMLKPDVARGCHGFDIVPGQKITLTFVATVTSEAVGLWELRLRDGFNNTATQRFVVRGSTEGGYKRTVSQLVVVVVAAVGVILLVSIIVIIVVCRRRDNIKSASDLPLRLDHSRKKTDTSRDALYRGSNVSISITNNIYDITTDVKATTPGLATDLDPRGHGQWVQETCAESAILGEYCSVADNVRNMPGSRPSLHHYQDISDVRGIVRQPTLPPPLPPKNHVTVDRAKDIQHTSNQYVSIQDIKDRKKQSIAKKPQD